MTRGFHPFCVSLEKDRLVWFCVMTEANAEAKAALRLKDVGYEVCYPVRQRLTRHARRIRTVLRAYYPRYLFTGFEPGHKPVAEIKTQRGVVALLGTVRGDVVEKLQTIAAHNGGVMPSEDDAEISTGRPVFRKNDKLIVTEGPFTGLTGIFDRNEGKRVAILLEMFRGGSTRVQFESSQVRLVA